MTLSPTFTDISLILPVAPSPKSGTLISTSCETAADEGVAAGAGVSTTGADEAAATDEAITISTSPSLTSAPICATIFSTVPSISAGTSASALSILISAITVSFVITSPTFTLILNNLPTTPSPRLGTLISTLI